MADLEGAVRPGYVASAWAISARARVGCMLRVAYTRNQDVACMSACFLLCMVGLMQCNHTYMRYHQSTEKSPWPMASRCGRGRDKEAEPRQRGMTRTAANFHSCSLPRVLPAAASCSTS